jgi:hypothetical protein
MLTVELAVKDLRWLPITALDCFTVLTIDLSSVKYQQGVSKCILAASQEDHPNQASYRQGTCSRQSQTGLEGQIHNQYAHAPAVTPLRRPHRTLSPVQHMQAPEANVDLKAWHGNVSSGVSHGDRWALLTFYLQRCCTSSPKRKLASWPFALLLYRHNAA